MIGKWEAVIILLIKDYCIIERMSLFTVFVSLKLVHKHPKLDHIR